MPRWLTISGGVVVVLAILLWVFRLDLLLGGLGLMMRLRAPVGPNQPVVWDSGPDPRGRAKGERPPNIVLILADDLGWNDLSFGGGGVAGGSVPTPHIDSLATEGASFTSGYAANGTCAPSRAAIMSGRYGTRFGFEFTPTPPGMGRMTSMISARMPGRLRQPIVHEREEALGWDEMGMPASEITIAELLEQADYQTAHIGKWHLGGEASGSATGMSPHEQGFDQSLLMASGLYLPEDHPDVVNSKQDFDPIDVFLWSILAFAASFNGSERFEPGGYLTDYYTDQAVEVIEANRDRPFFLYLAHWTPHTPLQALRADYDALSHIEDHRLRVYAAMIRSLDRSVGRVLEALRENGLEDDTIVMFTSDNGAPNYIGLPEVNDPFRGWKISFFEGGIHVPYFIKWPGRVPAGTTVDAPVHHFDLFATAAAAAGVPVPTDRKIDGVDLVPFARAEQTGTPHDRLFWRTGHYQVALVDGWKLQVTERPGEDHLYHLAVDPTEQVNLAASEPAKVAELKGYLAAHNAEQSAPLWPHEVEAPIKIDTTLADPDRPDDVYIYWPN